MHLHKDMYAVPTVEQLAEKSGFLALRDAHLQDIRPDYIRLDKTVTSVSIS